MMEIYYKPIENTMFNNFVLMIDMTSINNR